MICAIVPTLNTGPAFSPLLKSLKERCERVVVTDGGSNDDTLRRAVGDGAIIVTGSRGRGTQLARGARWASDADWLLVLHADVKLHPDWHRAVQNHIKNVPDRVGYFRFGADTKRLSGRLMEFIVGLRSFWWRLPYGDQGLLISRSLYEQIGGYPDVPLFEDVGILDNVYKALGRRGFRAMPVKIMTDVSAYERDGFGARTARNFRLLRAYRRGVSIETLLKDYT